MACTWHCCILCSYCVSAKTGRNIKSTFLSIAADLAGVPLTQQELVAAADTGNSSSSTAGALQQLRVDLPASPGAVPASPAVGSTGGLRSRKLGSCDSDARACSTTPKQQAMQRTEQQEGDVAALQEEAEGAATGLIPVPTCRCCCHCTFM
jgi:hypothetical protein